MIAALRKPLLERVREVVIAALEAYADEVAAREPLRALLRRLDEPLRVAVAGRVKSGKSTLLNALVGEPLAATDTGECTRFVTWYRHGRVYRTLVQPLGGPARQVPLQRLPDRIEPSLDGIDPNTIERLIVEWPSPLLRTMSLIDTPGLGSLTAAVGARTAAFLTPDDAASPADGIVYLARHLHAYDVRFLETFHDEDAGRPDPINAVAVLARADEVGAARTDAMETAGRVADRYRRDPQVRRLCQTVVPVAGLLALGASLLSEDDFAAFRQLAILDDETADDILVSTDRFRGLHVDRGPPVAVRAELLDRYGLFGVRLARSLVRSGAARSARQLVIELRRQSGIDELRHVLDTQLAARTGILKARAAITSLHALMRRLPPNDGGRLATVLEAVEAGAHELAEHRVLLALRSGVLELPDDAAEEVERLCESAGAPPGDRLGLNGDVSAEALSREIVARVQRWHRRAEHPLASTVTVDAARIVARSYEGMLLELG